jgi:hypothetical protein
VEPHRENEAIQPTPSTSPKSEEHLRARAPTCPLCGGVLAVEKYVYISYERFSLAWVCTQCSAAFPIALGKWGFLGQNPQPLYAWGERIKSK